MKNKETLIGEAIMSLLVALEYLDCISREKGNEIAIIMDDEFKRNGKGPYEDYVTEEPSDD